jgi:ribosomal protein S27AE
MKNGKCPKCGSAEIMNVTPQGGTMIQTSLTNKVKMTRLVCGGCGYSEEWVMTDLDLREMKRRFGKEQP